MKRKVLFMCLLVLCLGMMAGSAFADTPPPNVDYCVNPGFEDGVDPVAAPWSFWGGTGGALPNPFVDLVNPSPRCWSNFGNPTYVNVAAQNNMSLITLHHGETYYYHALYYVPASEIVEGTTAVAAIGFSMMTAPFVWVLPDSIGDPAVINPAAVITPDAWNVFEGSWVYNSPTATDDQVNYGRFMLYGRNLVTNARFPNPGGYFDDCQFGTTPNVPQFTITASAGANGDISPSGAVKVGQGSSKTFTFKADAGYVPDEVTIDGGTPVPAGDSYTIDDVQADGSISVTFIASDITYEILSEVVGGNGTIDPTPSATVPINGDQTFNFTPDEGYQVDTVTVDGNLVPTATSYTFTRVNADATISVTFKAQVFFNITASAGIGGSIDPSGIVPVLQGADQTFNFTADPGYKVNTVSIDGGIAVPAEASYTIENVQADGTIGVTFVKYFTISGLVTDLATGLPASGVKLKIYSVGFSIEYTTETDVDGIYSVDAQADIPYVVELVDPQTPTVVLLTPLAERSQDPEGLGLIADWVVDLDVLVAEAVTGISGVVRDSATNLPIPNAVVQSGGKNGPGALTNAAGEYSIMGLVDGYGDLYADAVGYAGRLLWVTGAGNLGCDILLTPAVEPLSYNGDMEDLVNPLPAQWAVAPWSNPIGCMDWLASLDAKSGAQSLFYTYNETTTTDSDYAGILKILPITAGYDYNFWFSAKGDPEVMAWQPMIEFMDALGNNWNGFVSSDPAYFEYSHMPPAEWLPYFQWMDRNGTKNGAPIRYTPSALQTEVHFIFLYEDRVGNTGQLIWTEDPPGSLEHRMPLAGKGCYIDDLMLDAVPQDMTYEVVEGTVLPFGIAGKVLDVSDVGICNAVVQLGAGGPTVVTDCDGKYSFLITTPAAGVALYADALGNADVTEVIDTNDVLTAPFGMLIKDITLPTKDESDISYVQNGGFETVVAGSPVGWGVGLAGAPNGPGSGTQSYLTADAIDPACGTYSAKFLPIIQNYEGVVQFIPVIADSTYNLYWKLKSDTGVRGAWTWIYWTNDAGDELADLYNNWNWWAAPTVWTQYPGTIAACGDNWTGVYAPIVGAVPPAGATRMYLYFGCESPDPPGGDIWPWEGGSLDIDDVVVDRIGPAYIPPYTGPFYGVNNKSVLTDDKLVGKHVKVWGNIISIDPGVSYVISDGYSAGVTINGSTTQIVGDMAVVKGVVQADKSVTP
ncbi:MAG: hypothetical protein NT018_09880 [Armatimonadetes bacterium]|nr:hypothetical protein [Armatimonadota bacterium]